MDPRLAFAKVRMLIEEAIQRIHPPSDTKPRSLANAIDNLDESPAIKRSLDTIIRFSNSLIHGAEYDSGQAAKLFDLAISLIIHLDITDSEDYKTIEYKQISNEEREVIDRSVLIVRTLIPYVDNPEIRTYEINSGDTFLQFGGHLTYFLTSIRQFSIRGTPYLFLDRN